MFLYKQANREEVSKIPNRKIQENIASTPKSDLDGQQKVEISRIGAKGVRRHVSSCTKPNISSVALRAFELPRFFDFFALEVLLFGKLFIWAEISRTASLQSDLRPLEPQIKQLAAC